MIAISTRKSITSTCKLCLEPTDLTASIHCYRSDSSHYPLSPVTASYSFLTGLRPSTLASCCLLSRQHRVWSAHTGSHTMYFFCSNLCSGPLFTQNNNQGPYSGPPGPPWSGAYDLSHLISHYSSPLVLAHFARATLAKCGFPQCPSSNMPGLLNPQSSVFSSA